MAVEHSDLCGEGVLWEQSLLAKQSTRFLKDRIASIAGKPCSHKKFHDYRYGVRLEKVYFFISAEHAALYASC